MWEGSLDEGGGEAAGVSLLFVSSRHCCHAVLCALGKCFCKACHVALPPGSGNASGRPGECRGASPSCRAPWPASAQSRSAVTLTTVRTVRVAGGAGTSLGSAPGWDSLGPLRSAEGGAGVRGGLVAKRHGRCGPGRGWGSQDSSARTCSSVHLLLGEAPVEEGTRGSCPSAERASVPGS